MRSSNGLVPTLLIVCAASALAAPASRDVVLAPDVGDRPAAILTADAGDVLTVAWTLPRLAVTEIEADGRTWQMLTFPGAAQRGDEGRPGLPVFGRLVALPDGATATARIAAIETRTLDGYRPLPAQPREGEPFLVSPDYADGAASQPSVTIGPAGTLHGMRVAPLTVSPLGYDPATVTVTAAVRMTIEIHVDGGAGKTVAAPTAAAFDAFLRDRLVNPPAPDKSATCDPGTWLMVYPDVSGVESALAPLIDWRRRQGYNVVAVSTATTGTTNTSIRSYLQTAYATSDPELVFVTLVGDANGTVALPSWPENLSSYGGAGDHYYAMLDGIDILPDVHLGRMSVQSVAELTTVVGKIVGYETAPPLIDDPGWFTRGSLVGDPGSSGITCIYVNQWVRDQLLAHHYTEIDSVYGGNFSSLLVANYNKGATLFTYRGWYGMSGVQPTYLLNLSNGDELGFAVIMTCDTGSFVPDATCRSEAVFRAPNGGGVASIGTATIGTHTRYNNCMFTGVIDGVYNSGDYRVGPALTSGKLAMYDSYAYAEPEEAEIWMVWNNLIGDPATEIWTAFPSQFSVSHAAAAPDGADSFQVAVTDDATGLPVPGARVTLFKKGEVRVNGLTDADGAVNLPLSAYSPGDLQVTVSEHDFVPYRGTVAVGGAGSLVGLHAVALDGDGQANPGETAEVTVDLENFGAATATGLSASLVSDDPYVSVTSGNSAWADLAPGASAPGATPFAIAIDPGAPAGHRCQLDLTTTSSAGVWTSLVELEIVAGAFAPVSVVYGGDGGTPDPGETGTLTVTLRNDGNADVTGATANLATTSPWVAVSDADGAYGALARGATGSNAGDTFTISAASDCFRGHLAVFQLALETAAGARDTVEFTLRVGTVLSNEPFGPDAYGYYAFDNTDTAYPYAPAYQWVEIDPTLGGGGTSLGLTDFGWEQDDTVVLDLPFAFTYYGESFDKISVCSNGWLSLGVTSLVPYRNWSLPCAGAPDAQICAFWDNLYLQSGSGGVFQWYDAANHRLVIEWSRLRNDAGGAVETFEVILYDPAHHESDTGDGVIDVQYDTISQVDATNGYATVGMTNLDRTGGLLYSYWNRYTAGAAGLASGRAIRFVALAALPSGTLQGTVTNATGGGIPAKDVQISVLGAGRAFTTAANGAFAGSVPVGTYDVVASHPSFAPDTTRNVTILEDQTTTVDFSLSDVAGPEFANTTVLTGTPDTSGPYVVETEVSDYTGLDAVHGWYLTSASPDLHELTLTLVDAPTGLYRGEIPGQPLDTRVRYWFAAEDVTGLATVEPAAAPAGSYAFWVQETLIASSDMETDDGWTSGAAGDDATTGLWTRVDPNGVWNNDTLVTPEDDHTDAGTMCWITGQDSQGAAQGENDVDGGTTTLLSPVYDLTGWNDVAVSYFRWYTNETGFAPGEDVWIVQATDDGSTWVDVENTTLSDRSWHAVNVPLDGLIAMTANVRFRFVASDLGSGSVVEAGVDDFALNGLQGTVDVLDPTVAVTAPLPGDVFSGGAPVVAWTASDDGAVVTALIQYSADGGATWPYLLGAGALASPYAPDWSGLPDGSTALVRVVCFDGALNAGQDAMDGAYTWTTATAVPGPGLPARLALKQNRPNPFNPATEIRFALPRAADVELRIYDLSGRCVRTLVRGRLEAGEHVETWTGVDDRGARVASGAYFYRLRSGDETVVRKMMLVK